MMRLQGMMLWTVVVISVCLVSLTTAEEQGAESSSGFFQTETIVRAHHKLSAGLYKTFARKPGNLIISPWSVMTLLTVTYLVANGRTANEIGAELSINLLRRKEILAGFQHLNNISTTNGDGGNSSSSSSSSEVLKSLNGVLLGKRVRSGRRLQRQLRENLGTYLHKVFAKTPGGERREVGPWWNESGADSGVEGADEAAGFTPPDPDALSRISGSSSRGEKVPGQLGGLVPGDDGLDSSMSFWLFNWMSFQGEWRSPFSPRDTHQAQFWIRGQESVLLPTMTVKANFPWSHFPQLALTLLELPYGPSSGGDRDASGRYGLFVLLPDERNGLGRMERRLKQFTLESLLAQPHWDRKAKVFLPKFKFRTDIMLNEVMKKMGYRRMFDPKEADFSRLLPKNRKGKKSPYVQTMIHRAAIEVNEKGTLASASSALRLTHRKYVHYIRVNHPFMFVLRDKTLGINLFVGRVTDPRELS